MKKAAKKRRGRRAAPVLKRASAAEDSRRDRPIAAKSQAGVSRSARWLGGVILAAVFLWAYYPTLQQLVHAWRTVPDYSHGFLVIPLALYFAWARRDRMPEASLGLAWTGLGLLVLSGAARVFGALVHWNAVDGWSMLLCIAGSIWLLWGWRMLWWSAPSVVFLLFMIPAPYRVERWLSLPLQNVATRASCWVLQLLGQGAFPEGNVILWGDYRLEVAEACCGLRILIGVVALAFAFAVLVRRGWWMRLLMLASAIPVALAANIARIVATAFLYQFVSSEAAQAFTHDLAGWFMIPFAAALFALVAWFFGKLVRDVDVMDVKAVLQHGKA